MDVQQWIGCENTGSLGIQGDLEELEGWGGRGKGGRGWGRDGEGREGGDEGRKGRQCQRGEGKWGMETLTHVISGEVDRTASATHLLEGVWKKRK